jgi:hypothetical protein
MAGSIGIIMAIGVSAIFGWFLILGLLFSIQDLDATINSATGQPVTQIFLDTVGQKGAIVLMESIIFMSYQPFTEGDRPDHCYWRNVFLRVCETVPNVIFNIIS